MDPRIRVVCDMFVAESWELAGIHDYDGVVQDLSPAGVSAGLARVGAGGSDPSDLLLEDHLAAFEARARVMYGDLEMHKRSPVPHLDNLAGPAARPEAARAAFDPGYGCYTFGKLEILALRDEAERGGGSVTATGRFHDALLRMSSPPLGLIGSILD